MVHLKITKGLDIPLPGQPTGEIQTLPTPSSLSLNLRAFEHIQFKLLVKVDDQVKIGQPLLADKSCPSRLFVSPASGVVREIRRGYKRSPVDVVVELDHTQQHIASSPRFSSRQELVETLLQGGFFAHIRQRPFHLLADPFKRPRAIFIKALESAPLTPPAEIHIQGLEREFACGVEAIKKLTLGDVHLVYRKETTCKALLQAEHVLHHTATGPHPVANSSVHIQHIDPIQGVEDVVWILPARCVVEIGHYLLWGRHLTQRIISIAGPSIAESKSGFFRIHTGMPISALIANRVLEGSHRYISGDPLMGHQVDEKDFLGFEDTAFTVIPEPSKRELLHFFRLGKESFTASNTYSNPFSKRALFTTSLHGEARPFITAGPSSSVMPLNVHPVLLCKALMAEDYELAESLGLLEVAPEDFALPTFVEPSKVEMTEIVKRALFLHSQEVLH